MNETKRLKQPIAKIITRWTRYERDRPIICLSSIVIAIIIISSLLLLTFVVIAKPPTASPVRQKRAATARLDRLWDNAIIPYEIDASLSGDRRALFKQAMRHWENYTCIKFIERTEEHYNYIVFTERSCGCCSFVGKRGNGPQAISIGKHCDKFGIVVHELGHVVGFWHEHTRPDRDQHVQIIHKNIMSGQEYNFNKLTSEEVNSLGLAYDYDSIMHYATNTFAKNTYLDTILPLHGPLNTEETLQQQQQRQQQQQQQLLLLQQSAVHRALSSGVNVIINMSPPSFSPSSSPSVSPSSTSSYYHDQYQSMMLSDATSLASTKANGSINKTKIANAGPVIMIVDGDIMVIPQIDHLDDIILDENAHDRYHATGNQSHRSARDARSTGSPLLVKTRPEIGQRIRLSVGDIAQTNLLYKCPKCGRTIQQANGTFQSVNYVPLQGDTSALTSNIASLPLNGTMTEPNSTTITSSGSAISSRPLHIQTTTQGAPLSIESTSQPYNIVGHNNDYNNQTKQSNAATSEPSDEQSNNTNSSDAKVASMNSLNDTSIETVSPIEATTVSNSTVQTSSIAPTAAPIEQTTSITTSNTQAVAVADQQQVRANSIDYQGELCEWRLTASLGERIQLNITDMDIAQEQSTAITNELPVDSQNRSPTLTDNKSAQNHCPTDYLEIRDGYWHKSPLLARLCGQVLPTKPLVSSGHRLLVTYKTSAAGAGRRGFRAHHETICGGYIYYRGPDSASVPPVITGNGNNSKGPTDDDRDDSSSLLTTTESTSGRQYNITNVDQSNRTATPELFITPVAGQPHRWANQIHNSGAANTNVIQSPNWPEHYRSNKECIWLIKVDEQYQVSLKFDSFDIESHDSCDYDYVEVRDGHNPSSNLLGRFCGFKVPEQLVSSGDKLMVKFVSDSDVNRAGFSATFQRELNECKSGSHGCSYKCSNQVSPYKCECPIGFELASDGKNCEPTCGGFKNESTGSLSSPSFPDLYPASTKCVWEIVAPAKYKITINFTHFELEGKDQDCDYDYVDIRSRLEDGKYHKNGIYCGQRNQPLLVTSVANSMRIEFNSDNSVQKSGFVAQYFTDKDECASNNGGCQHICRNTIESYQCACHNGFVLHENRHSCVEGHCTNSITTPEGVFHSPNYPMLYPPNKECAWIFSTIAGHRIKLIFDQFDLENHQECAYDHVAVYDGLSVEDSTLGRFCGSRKPLTLVSSFDKMYLLFRSDATNERRGFNATHSTVCGGRLPAQVGQNDLIYSHAEFDQRPYNKNEDCEWLIEAPENQRVKIKFNIFELEHANDCNYDSVEIYDGPDDSAPQLARLCGNKLPPEFASTGESLLIAFRSDDSVNNKGFLLSYTAFEANDDDQQLANIPSTLVDNGGSSHISSSGRQSSPVVGSTTINSSGTGASNMQADTRTGQISYKKSQAPISTRSRSMNSMVAPINAKQFEQANSIQTENTNGAERQGQMTKSKQQQVFDNMHSGGSGSASSLSAIGQYRRRTNHNHNHNHNLHNVGLKNESSDLGAVKVDSDKPGRPVQAATTTTRTMIDKKQLDNIVGYISRQQQQKHHQQQQLQHYRFNRLQQHEALHE